MPVFVSRLPQAILHRLRYLRYPELPRVNEYTVKGYLRLCWGFHLWSDGLLLHP